ncbi:unnamed protein product, partial [Ectocarpus sp. 12 AP-2014]
PRLVCSTDCTPYPLVVLAAHPCLPYGRRGGGKIGYCPRFDFWTAVSFDCRQDQRHNVLVHGNKTAAYQQCDSSKCLVHGYYHFVRRLYTWMVAVPPSSVYLVIGQFRGWFGALQSTRCEGCRETGEN